MSPLQVGKAQEVEAVEEGRVMICSGCRDQLRTDEAIEQAADILSFETTGGCYPKADEQCRHVMRRVLETLLGDTP